MKPTSFAPDTETILQLFSSSDTIDCLPSVPRRKSTAKLLGDIYDDMITSCKSIQRMKRSLGPAFNNVITRAIQSGSVPVPKTLGLSSVPRNVHAYIHTKSSYLFQFSSRIGERKICVKFITDHTEAAPHVDTYTKHFERMLLWFDIAFKHAPDACGTNICVYIYDTPLRKSLPERQTDIVGIAHANTAFTYACPITDAKSGRSSSRSPRSVAVSESEIVLFRNEEWFKVFIHETFHMLGLDFAGMPNLDAARATVRDVFPVKSDMNLFETYTETWASIINACFCSYLCFGNRLSNQFADKASFVNAVELLLGFEAAWRIFQMHKVLRFMGVTYSDLHSTSAKAVIARTHLYRENTNIFAYYVLTAVLLVNYGDFLEWCDNNNGVGGIMTFRKTEANTVAFAQLITRVHSTAATRKNVRAIGSKKCFNAISESSSESVLGDDGESEEWVANTMRMTVCELG